MNEETDNLTSSQLDFLKHLSTSVKASTIPGVKSCISCFIRFLNSVGIFSSSKISIETIYAFVDCISPTHRSSMGTYVIYLKKYLNYLHSRKQIRFNPDTLYLRAAQRQKRSLPAFDQTEIQCILNAIDRNTYKGKRDYAIINLAIRTGLRLSDIISLELYNVKWETSEIHVSQAKTGIPLRIPLDFKTAEALSIYILEARPTANTNKIFLRCQNPHTALKSVGCGNNIIKKYLRIAGISYEAFDGKRFHAFRRALATNLLNSGVPMTTISQILGHKNMDSLKPYLSLNESMLKFCALSLSEMGCGEVKLP